MAIDDYFTAPTRARDLVAELSDLIDDVDLFVEPSTGGGAFLDHLPDSTIALDLAPRAPGIHQADFLTWEPPAGDQSIAIVGNPPFGHAGHLARKFFNHAAIFADYIAFILPASYAKASMQAKLDPRFHLIHECHLPDEPFTKDGAVHRFNTVFQVWEKRTQLREIRKATTTHADFAFVKSPEEADFAIRRVGAHAGKIIEIPTEPSERQGLSASSNYFIRATGRAPREVWATFAHCDFNETRSQAVAVPSIGKGDLIACYDSAACMTRVCSDVEQPGATDRVEASGQCIDTV
ncbi:MAG: hypothetical protein HOY44_22100 [Maritimibacter sp.]|uniref:hypothetical protein n=1 Tax=Maritimibacter sp. TaxID=2003363 RepID=UPI001D4679F7|nr:hypothetical protein [Maritimibacter sp.]MBL6430213.1 hypothetical protein [Maritimibacter sp.]